MEHKNYDMICAKAENMDLVIFARTRNSEFPWVESNFQILASYFDNEYFLCLPQHKEACLHWLNGGDVLVIRFDNPMPGSGVMLDSVEVDLDEDVNSYPWKLNHVFMDKAQTISIKPRKEKRWIAVKCNGSCVIPKHYESKETAERAAASLMAGEFQLIEIEVEI